MSANKKVLALAAVMFMGAGAVHSAEARQASLVPLGMAEVDPSWVAPSFVEVAAAPLQPAAEPKITKATPKTGGAAVEEDSSSPSSSPSSSDDEEAEKAGDKAAADAMDADATDKALKQPAVESDSSSSSDDDDKEDAQNVAAEAEEPVAGGLDPKKILIKADNEEDSSSSSEETRRTPPTELLPKGKDLQRSPEVEAALQKKADKAADAAKIKKLNDAGKAALKKDEAKATTAANVAKAVQKVDDDAKAAATEKVGKDAETEQKQAGNGGKIEGAGDQKEEKVTTVAAKPTVPAVGAVSKTQETKIVADATKTAAAAAAKK